MLSADRTRYTTPQTQLDFKGDEGQGIGREGKHMGRDWTLPLPPAECLYPPLTESSTTSLQQFITQAFCSYWCRSRESICPKRQHPTNIWLYHTVQLNVLKTRFSCRFRGGYIDKMQSSNRCLFHLLPPTRPVQSSLGYRGHDFRLPTYKQKHRRC